MTDLRRCIGSARFGIEAHDAPPEEFPVQPSQKDGLGRMCRTHWNAYTAGLAHDAKARTAADGVPAAATAGTKAVTRRRSKGTPEPIRTRPPRKGRHTAASPVEVAREASAK